MGSSLLMSEQYMCALYKLTIYLLMFVKGFADTRHLGHTLQRNVVPLERGSEKEEINGGRNAFVLNGKRMWREIPRTSASCVFPCDEGCGRRRGTLPKRLGSLARTVCFYTLPLVCVTRKRKQRGHTLDWTTWQRVSDTGFQMVSRVSPRGSRGPWDWSA